MSVRGDVTERKKRMSTGNGRLYDVVVIGGGVVGSAIARELTRYRLKVAVLEKNPDVCYETSGRNTGVCHGGFAYDTGSLKAKLCVAGNAMMGELTRELEVPFERTGKVLVGSTQEEYNRLLEVIAQGEKNGAKGLRMIDKDELAAIVPSVVGEFAMLSEDSGILDPFLLTIALAENAVQNGAEYYLCHEVTAISRERGGCDDGKEEIYRITAGGSVFSTRWVVNSAGLNCEKISRMLGIDGYRMIYSKDDYIILDPRLGSLVPMPIYTVPSNTYMGIHVTRTTDGNVLLGPTAENTDNNHWYGVEKKNIDMLYEEAMKIWPHVKRADYIRTYSGILPKWVDEDGQIQDFRIEVRDDIAPRAVNLIGIESPGLTACRAIALRVLELIGERENLTENERFDPHRKGITRFSDLPEELQSRLIEEDPDYGEFICRCQKITKAQIMQAIRNPLGVRTMTGIKYRTRAMMGRCQGGYCQMRVAQLLEQTWGLKPDEVWYARKGSSLFFGKVRDDHVGSAVNMTEE